MPYAALSDLRKRLGAAVFDAVYGSSALADFSDRADAADDLASAQAEIDGALAFRYALPVSAPQSLALLRDWCLTLAEERAFARSAGGEFAEKVKSRVELVRRFLEQIRAGTFRLPDAVEKKTGTIAVVQSDKPIFSRGNMTGF